MDQKRVLRSLTNNNLKKTAVAAILFLLLATGLTLFIQPAKAASVTILSHSGYLSPYGNYRIDGEVQNLDTIPAGWVKITATYYDSSNAIIAVEDGYTYAYVILPNRKEPFYFWLSNETQAPKVDHYTLEVAPTSNASALPLGLKILSSSAYIDNGGWMNITGEVENTGTTNASSSLAYATCYDIEGKVVAVFHGTLSQLTPGQKLSFDILIEPERVPLVKTYVVGARSHEYASFESPSMPAPTATPTPSSTPTSTITSPTPSASLSPTPTSSVAPSPTTTAAAPETVAWVPSPANAAAATVVTAVAVGVFSVAVASLSNPVGTSAGKAAEKTSDLLPESVKKWLSDFASSKRKPILDQKTGSPFLPTKTEALAYGVSLVVLTISFSYVKVADFTQILAVLPTILATAIIVEFVKTFSLVAFARSLGVWTEHRLWYFGLAMFLITTFAFGIPFSSPSRSLYHAPQFTKRREGIVASAAILVTLAFAALFFALLISGFTLIGSTGLAMCVIMGFLDTFPVAPMNGKAIYQHSKAAWAALFAVSLAVYLSWLILL